MARATYSQTSRLFLSAHNGGNEMPSLIRVFMLSAGGLYLWLLVTGGILAMAFALTDWRWWFALPERDPVGLADALERHPAARGRPPDGKPLLPYQTSVLDELEADLRGTRAGALVRRARLARACRSADREGGQR